MDDLKHFGKIDDQIDSLIQTVLIFIGIGMEFGLKKWEVVILNKGKLVNFDEIYLTKK